MQSWCIPTCWVAPTGLIVQWSPGMSRVRGHSYTLRFFFQLSVHALDLLSELGNHLGQLWLLAACDHDGT